MKSSRTVPIFLNDLRWFSMKFTHAITRTPCPDFGRGLTTSNLGTPNYQSMCDQHEHYIQLLGSLGVSVENLPYEADFPDAHFVEDTAVVTPEIAIITRPGADARKGETPTIAAALKKYRELLHISSPGTVDGGDILLVGRHVFIGISERTNADGARQLTDMLSPFGYTCIPVPVAAGLHFKSSVNMLTDDTLLVTQDFSDRPELNGFRILTVPAGENYAGNTLAVNGTLMVPEGYPKTLALLRSEGFETCTIDTEESRKMDGGLTCLSLRFTA